VIEDTTSQTVKYHRCGGADDAETDADADVDNDTDTETYKNSNDLSAKN